MFFPPSTSSHRPSLYPTTRNPRYSHYAKPSNSSSFIDTIADTITKSIMPTLKTWSRAGLTVGMIYGAVKGLDYWVNGRGGGNGSAGSSGGDGEGTGVQRSLTASGGAGSGVSEGPAPIKSAMRSTSASKSELPNNWQHTVRSLAATVSAPSPGPTHPSTASFDVAPAQNLLPATSSVPPSAPSDTPTSNRPGGLITYPSSSQSSPRFLPNAAPPPEVSSSSARPTIEGAKKRVGFSDGSQDSVPPVSVLAQRPSTLKNPTTDTQPRSAFREPALQQIPNRNDYADEEVRRGPVSLQGGHSAYAPSLPDGDTRLTDYDHTKASNGATLTVRRVTEPRREAPGTSYGYAASRPPVDSTLGPSTSSRVNRYDPKYPPAPPSPVEWQSDARAHYDDDPYASSFSRHELPRYSSGNTRGTSAGARYSPPPSTRQDSRFGRESGTSYDRRLESDRWGVDDQEFSYTSSKKKPRPSTLLTMATDGEVGMEKPTSPRPSTRRVEVVRRPGHRETKPTKSSSRSSATGGVMAFLKKVPKGLGSVVEAGAELLDKA